MWLLEFDIYIPDECGYIPMFLTLKFTSASTGLLSPKFSMERHHCPPPPPPPPPSPSLSICDRFPSLWFKNYKKMFDGSRHTGTKYTMHYKRGGGGGGDRRTSAWHWYKHWLWRLSHIIAIFMRNPHLQKWWDAPLCQIVNKHTLTFLNLVPRGREHIDCW